MIPIPFKCFQRHGRMSKVGSWQLMRQTRPVQLCGQLGERKGNDGTKDAN